MMTNSDDIRKIIEAGRISASAPCRIDLGGTLDIGTFHYPLSYLNPCTFNIAIDLRTHVSILPHKKDFIKISSRGFEDAEYRMNELPFSHPMGLMFAIAAYFRVGGLHIHIDSSSPPRSALGGSSSAAIAMIGAYNRIFHQAGIDPIPFDRIALLAHAIEEGVAGVPCGLQDQLAAVYGGINAWVWKGRGADQLYARRQVSEPASHAQIEKSLLLAYCGIPHESKNINGQWVKEFLAGNFREHWVQIVTCTNAFVDAFSSGRIHEAVRLMNRETGIRLEMTPDVLDETGKKLFDSAGDRHCGARFTGAGGGGCIWALGEPEHILSLKSEWASILCRIPGAALLDVKIDSSGLLAG
jgi:D-glycero-alpha-D-manno-heptose-7-phosphate kinase